MEGKTIGRCSADADNMLHSDGRLCYLSMRSFDNRGCQWWSSLHPNLLRRTKRVVEI